MGVSVLNLKSAVMSVSRTSGMTGMKVSKPAPMTVTLVTAAGETAVGGIACAFARLRVFVDIFVRLTSRFLVFDRMFPVVLDN